MLTEEMRNELQARRDMASWLRKFCFHVVVSSVVIVMSIVIVDVVIVGIVIVIAIVVALYC